MLSFKYILRTLRIMMKGQNGEVLKDVVGVEDEQGDVVAGKIEEEVEAVQISQDEEGLSKEIGPGQKGGDEVDW